MLTQIDGYFRAGQPTRYLPRTSYLGERDFAVAKDTQERDLAIRTTGNPGNIRLAGGSHLIRSSYRF
jgi:hypothetical protein